VSRPGEAANTITYRLEPGVGQPCGHRSCPHGSIRSGGDSEAHHVRGQVRNQDSAANGPGRPARMPELLVPARLHAGVARPVAIWDNDERASPHAGQKRLSAATAAEQAGQRIRASRPEPLMGRRMLQRPRFQASKLPRNNLR